MSVPTVTTKRQAATVAVPGMRAVVVAGHKTLVNAALGEYTGQQRLYPWPDVDGKIDESSVTVVADDAELVYYSGNAVVENANTVEVGITLKSNTFRGTTYPRSPLLYDRDCRPGDVIAITKGSTTVTATIAGLSGQYVQPSVSVEADPANQPTQAQQLSAPQISGPTNSVTISQIIIDNYDGTEYDALNTIYYVRVVAGGPPNDAKLRIRHIAEGSRVITPSDWGMPTLISDRGILVTFTRSGSDVFVVGQEWRVTISQAYTAAGLVCNATAYSGTTPRTYKITVVDGGLFPKITYSAPGDSGGPVAVGTSPTIIGKYGITVNFQRVPACLNDVFYITALPGGVANYTKVSVSTPLPPEVLGTVTASLCIAADIVVPRIRLSQPGAFNYTLSAAGITCPAGMLVYEPTWTDEGVPIPISVRRASLVTKYWVWRDDLSTRMRFASSLDDITAIAGPYAADNHLKTALYVAFMNSGDAPVGYIAVADPENINSWRYALSAIDDTEVHSVIVVAPNAVMAEAVAEEIKQLNSEGRRLVAWMPAIMDETELVKIAACEITVVEDGEGQYRLVTLYGATTSELIPGDEVRFNFGSDPWGQQTYASGFVNVILSDTQVTLRESLLGPITEPTPAMFVASLAYDDNKKRLALLRANSYNHPAVRLVFANPDECYGIANVWYAFAAALGGLRSANYPRYPLIEPLELLTVEPSTFTADDLAELVSGGVTCVVRHGSNAAIVHDKVVTTAVGTPQHSEVYASVLDYCYKLANAAISRTDLRSVGSADRMVGVVGAVVDSALSSLTRGVNAYERALQDYETSVSVREEESSAPGGVEYVVYVDIKITLAT